MPTSVVPGVSVPEQVKEESPWINCPTQDHLVNRGVGGSGFIILYHGILSWHVCRYGGGAGNIVVENSSVFSLIRMR